MDGQKQIEAGDKESWVNANGMGRRAAMLVREN